MNHCCRKQFIWKCIIYMCETGIFIAQLLLQRSIAKRRQHLFVTNRVIFSLCTALSDCIFNMWEYGVKILKQHPIRLTLWTTLCIPIITSFSSSFLPPFCLFLVQGFPNIIQQTSPEKSQKIPSGLMLWPCMLSSNMDSWHHKYVLKCK